MKAKNYQLENSFSIEDRGPTDRVSNWDRNHNHSPKSPNPNFDLWPWPSVPGELWSGHNPYTCKRSRSKVTRFKS